MIRLMCWDVFIGSFWVAHDTTGGVNCNPLTKMAFAGFSTVINACFEGGYLEITWNTIFSFYVHPLTSLVFLFWILILMVTKRWLFTTIISFITNMSWLSMIRKSFLVYLFMNIHADSWVPVFSMCYSLLLSW